MGVGALTWSFDTWSACRQLDRETPLLTVADPCIWHGSGTNSADDSQPRRWVRRPTTHACASLHPHRPQPRCSLNVCQSKRRWQTHGTVQRPLDFHQRWQSRR